MFVSFGCFGMSRVKNDFFVVRKGSKRPIFSISPLQFTVKMTSNFAQNHQGACCYGTLYDQNLTSAHFDISVFLRVFLLTTCDFRKIGELWQLGGDGFWKAFRFFFKTLHLFACLTLPEKKDKGIISKILMRNLPEIVIFCPKIFK